MAKNKPIRIALAAFRLLSMPPVLAEGGWQHHKTGDGRWLRVNVSLFPLAALSQTGTPSSPIRYWKIRRR